MAPLFWQTDPIIFDLEPIGALCFCLFLAVLYVSSLYIGTSKQLPRDHPETIKHRFIRVTVVCLFCIPLLWLFSTKSSNVKAQPLLVWLGIRFEGCIMATILPLLLTMVLFLGPLSLHYLDGIFSLYTDKQYWLANIQNIIWIRNHVVAPVSEEFVFRGCMLPVLVPCCGALLSALTCPLFFGVAHFHHIFEKVREGQDLTVAVLNAMFQFSYTSAFGAYSAFLFLRTGHLIAPIMAHAFCNHMGFPDFGEVLAQHSPRRYIIMFLFVVGAVTWSMLLYPLTDPALYGNRLYQLN